MDKQKAARKAQLTRCIALCEAEIAQLRTYTSWLARRSVSTATRSCARSLTTMLRRRPNQWKIDRELALRHERERNRDLHPEFDEKIAERRLREGIERLRRRLDRDKLDNRPPF